MGPPHGPIKIGQPTSTLPQSKIFQGSQGQRQGASGTLEIGGTKHISQDIGMSSSGPGQQNRMRDMPAQQQQSQQQGEVQQSPPQQKSHFHK